MAQLVFYDKDHIYEVDGVKMDSVSEVLRFLSREEYDDINQYKLDNAASRGTEAHTACEVLYQYKKVECSEDVQPYVMAFIQFLKDHKCEFTDIEKPLADTELGIAGTPDFCGTVDGEESIVDLKAQSAIKKTLVKSQLNAYSHLRIVNGKPAPVRLYCLQLLATGKYRFYPVAIDDTEFRACLALHKALKTKHERGVIN
ncbi:MAG: hypothetical protein Q8873_00410 [Bacillota bacterium]|nr:hypothetical protein [Bacillota bacterium]